MMLVLSRKLGESIQIGPGIVIEVVHLDRRRCGLGIVAPSGVSIRRAELAAETMDDTNGTMPFCGMEAGREATRNATQTSTAAEQDAD